MKRRHRPHPHEPGPGELHLREAVESALGEAEAEGAHVLYDERTAESYLAFGREFGRELRSGFRIEHLDPSRAAERWFRRGLSGRALWLIGDALMYRQRPGESEVSHGTSH
jgi:hypothetical protein